MRSLFTLAIAVCLAGSATAVPALAQTPAPIANPVDTLAADRNFVVFFEEWSASFTPAAVAVIATAAKLAAANPGEPVIVTGTADPIGSARANALISALRAELVAEALIKAGVAPTRIQQLALGSTEYAFSSLESRRVTIAVGAK